MTSTFFYDSQIKRFLLQFTRMVSGFQVEYGRDDDVNVTLLQVPERYCDASRQAQTILQENSANGIPNTPIMTFYVTALEFERDRVQEPHHVSKMHVRQRTYNEAADTFDTTQGNAFTIERPMPVPYKLTINLDIWTSNVNQKLQLIEQIATLFNPAMEIQSTDNFVDWTSLTFVELERTNWTSRSVPVGTDTPIDICTFQFYIPIWISPPARVKKLGVINKIIAGIYDARGDAVAAIRDDDLLLGTRMQITPYGYQILMIGNELKALKTNALTTELDLNNTVEWKEVIEMYGVLRNGISLIRFFNDELGIEVSGTVAYHPLDTRTLLFNLNEDTRPANTIAPITAIVDPLARGPMAGLPAAAVGQRYLLVNDIGSSVNTTGPAAWGDVVAHTNDIVEFDGTNWVVSFNSAYETNTHFVTNITTEQQYIWKDQQWQKSFEGLYPGGHWTIVF